MRISRWKIMAGMFALSLGGLATVAGQGPDKPKPPMPAPVAPAIDFREPPLVVPASATVPVIPPAALVTPAGGPNEIAPLPSRPVPPKPAVAVPLPALESQKLPTPADPMPQMPCPDALKPSHTASGVILPAGPMPQLPCIDVVPPKAGPMMPVCVAPVMPVSAKQASEPVPAAVSPPEYSAPSGPLPMVSSPTSYPAVPPIGSSRYRIMLRMGDGEPMFEVRNGDELVMKVMCEKVDVKAPAEKGPGQSAVKAGGNVRFVGFGSEGVCDELSFLAGTGEVLLSGNVKIQVKDKLGRVESELSGEKMHYRLDAAHPLTGGMKP